ncbi:hypothetical protein HDU97_006286 [Phlyctochytrium planicorne]|nr:hypothetical protein HDU97_006286 [Phlyctochytrium planicorne]
MLNCHLHQHNNTSIVIVDSKPIRRTATTTHPQQQHPTQQQPNIPLRKHIMMQQPHNPFPISLLLPSDNNSTTTNRRPSSTLSSASVTSSSSSSASCLSSPPPSPEHAAPNSAASGVPSQPQLPSSWGSNVSYHHQPQPVAAHYNHHHYYQQQQQQQQQQPKQRKPLTREEEEAKTANKLADLTVKVLIRLLAVRFGRETAAQSKAAAAAAAAAAASASDMMQVEESYHHQQQPQQQQFENHHHLPVPMMGTPPASPAATIVPSIHSAPLRPRSISEGSNSCASSPFSTETSPVRAPSVISSASTSFAAASSTTSSQSGFSFDGLEPNIRTSYIRWHQHLVKLREMALAFAKNPYLSRAPYGILYALFLARRILLCPRTGDEESDSGLPKVPKQLLLNPSNLLLSCLLLAEASLSDRQTSTRVWAKVAGITTVPEMCEDELEEGLEDDRVPERAPNVNVYVARLKALALDALRFETVVSEEEFASWIKALRSLTTSSVEEEKAAFSPVAMESAVPVASMPPPPVFVNAPAPPPPSYYHYNPAPAASFSPTTATRAPLTVAHLLSTHRHQDTSNNMSVSPSPEPHTRIVHLHFHHHHLHASPSLGRSLAGSNGRGRVRSRSSSFGKEGRVGVVVRPRTTSLNVKVEME